MLIGICDDQPGDRAALTAALQEILNRRRLEAEVRTFPSAEALLSAMERERFAICFLDIFMDGISGVAAARRIRQRNWSTAIVFTTTSRDFMADGFEVGAAHYLVKPFTSAALSAALDRCLYLAGEAERFIQITVDRGPRRLLISQLQYAESMNKACILHLAGEVLTTWLPLDELERQLDDPRFLRCQRSFLVNLDHVKDIKGNEFLIAGGDRVPIRREGRAAMKVRFEQYLFEKARRR